ncbi:FtsX-like permease family protein [Streptomyces sp. NPDC051940]|uniref:FtsX-like permease family protein n=1 Tax=Streptomyces sp. NPDC051940 TaxID=3155675 RepID=UPI00343FF496
MFALALRSIRQRPGRFTATLLSAFLGAAIIMTFNSLYDTASAPGVDDVSAESLSTAAMVVGGYGTLLVFFAVASTLTVAVRQRSAEMELLRRTGATPAQLKRMVVGEAAVVALVGAALAIVPAMLGGRLLVELFQDSGQVADSVEYSFGPIALMSGVDTTLLASVGAAFLAVRRATRTQAAGRRRLRTWGGWAALGLGTLLAASTFAMGDAGPEAMAPPAYGAILLSVGFAVFSPALLTGMLRALAGPLSGSGSGWLALHGLRERAGRLTGVLMPLILFVGISTATLYMQAVENDRTGVTKTVDDKNLETLNFVVVGIIAVFACVMLVNTLYAATSYRAGEFGRQRLAGATPGQVLRTVGLESALLTLTGVAFGTLAALAGIIPFTVARTDSVLPGQGLGIWLAIAGTGAAATLGTTLATTRRALRTPAVEAVELAA